MSWQENSSKSIRIANQSNSYFECLSSKFPALSYLNSAAAYEVRYGACGKRPKVT